MDGLFFGTLEGRTRTIKSNSPVGCWAMGRAPSLPYDSLTKSERIGNEFLPVICGGSS